MFETGDTRQTLIPLESQPDIEDDTNERFSPNAVEAYLADTETFQDTHDHPTHHYNQAQDDWGSTDAVDTLLQRHDINSSDLTVTIVGGFTGEFARALRDLGCEVIFTDPLSDWTDRAQEDGFETYTCPAELLPADVLARTDALATFECYYPFQTNPKYSLYTALRALTTPEGLLFAETADTRRVRQDQGAELASLAIYNLLDGYIELETTYRETENLRLYQYRQTDRKRYQSVLIAEVLRYLYEYGDADTVTEVDESIVEEITEKMGSDWVTVSGNLQISLHMYRELLGELANITPPMQMQLCDHTYNLTF